METVSSLPCLQEAPPPLPILSQINRIHALPSHFLNIHLNIILPSSPWSSKWAPIQFKHQNPALTSPFHHSATCPDHLIFPDLITRIIFYEEYRSVSSSLRSFLQFCIPLPFLGRNILLSTLFSNTLNLRSSLNLGDENYRKNNSSVCLNHCVFRKKTGRQKIMHRLTANIPCFPSARNFFLNRMSIR